MNLAELNKVAEAMVAPGRGILAADESSGTIKKRFDAIGAECTEASRRDYREMLFRSSEAMSKYISGVILYDETIRQNAKDGTPLVKVIEKTGALPGIKVDKGVKPLPMCPGEVITEGLDGLGERLAEYRSLGAKFAKWRAVIDIGKDMPSYNCIMTNANAAGQVVFLPLLMIVIVTSGWRSALMMIAVAAMILIPAIWLWMRDNPADIGLQPVDGQEDLVLPVCVGLCLGLVSFLTAKLPPTYESKARIWMRGKLNLSEGRGFNEELASQVELLGSTTVYLKALDRLRQAGELAEQGARAPRVDDLLHPEALGRAKRRAQHVQPLLDFGELRLRVGGGIDVGAVGGFDPALEPRAQQSGPTAVAILEAEIVDENEEAALDLAQRGE